MIITTRKGQPITTVMQEQETVTPADYARRAWAVLIVAAQHRETIPYTELRRRIGYPGTAQSVKCVLYRIKHYCEAHNLPRLAALVVYASGMDQGQPGDGADADPAVDPHAAWDFDWLSCRPIIPAAAELELAHADACARKRLLAPRSKRMGAAGRMAG